MLDGEEMLSDRAKIFGHRRLIEIKIEESCMNSDKCFSQKWWLIPEASDIFHLSEQCQVKIPAKSVIFKALRT